MRNAVIVLNGASSSGKSSIVLELQGLLPRPYLAFGVDTLVASLPPASPRRESAIVLGSDGAVAVGVAEPTIDTCLGFASPRRRSE